MSDHESLSSVNEGEKENVVPVIQQWKLKPSPKKDDSFLESDSHCDESCEYFRECAKVLGNLLIYLKIIF